MHRNRCADLFVHNHTMMITVSCFASDQLQLLEQKLEHFEEVDLVTIFTLKVPLLAAELSCIRATTELQE